MDLSGGVLSVEVRLLGSTSMELRKMNSTVSQIKIAPSLPSFSKIYSIYPIAIKKL
jgi:hypothetical protein